MNLFLLFILFITSSCNDITSSSLEGCTSKESCNFNENAFKDDGSCIYPNENFDCNGNCTEELDCDGVCGGNKIEDECGVCGGDGISDGSCDCEGNIDLGCGCGVSGPSGCDNKCGSQLELDECGICGGPGQISDCGCEDIEEGKCDCEGNVLGCDDICGSETFIDGCGECVLFEDQCLCVDIKIEVEQETNIMNIFYSSNNCL